MKKLTFILFLILGLSLYSQKPYPDTLTTAASAAITPPPPPPIFTLCPGLFKCHDNYICGGDFENAPDPRFYDYFVQQWSTGQNAFMDNSVDIYTGNGISPTIEQWPHSLASKWTHGPFPVSAGSCVWTPLHIMAPQGNKFLGMTGMVTDPNPALFGGLWYSEGITFKLRKELTTGKTYTLKFYSRKPRKFTQCLDFNLEVRGSTMPPCKPNVSPGKTPLWAGAASWNPACGYQYSQIFSSSMITDTVWTEFTISFTANANIEYLLLSIPQYNASCPYICSPYGYFDDFRLYDNDPLKMSSVSVVSCGNTGSIKLTPSGGTPPYFYTWLDGATTKDRINVASGTYHVRVSDAARCDLDLQIINIPSIPPIAANEAIYHPRCKGSNDGSINLFPTGGTPPYTYAWTGGLPPNQHQFGLAPGSYKVTIKDKNDCIFTSEYDIIDTLRHIDLITNTTITPYVCGGAKGSIQVRPTGGVPPYNYLWADGNRDRDRIDLLPGPYTITVMDRNHCTKTETFIVPKTGVYSNAKITLTPSYHCNLNTANIVSNVTLGVPPYTYLWSTGSTQSFTNNVSTVGNPTVFITVTESTGCINLESIILKKYIDIGTGTIYPTASSAIGAGKPFSPITKSAGRERFRINGTFHVNSSIQLNYCDVIAKPGARIYVNASSLNMDSTTIRTCVDTMWQGIEVVQGAISLKRCTIEDALYAVEVKNINSNEQFDYNTFRNNYIGISYPPRANTSVQRFTYNTFTNNRFLCTTGRGSLKKRHSAMTFNPSSGTLQHGFYTGRAWAGMAICDFRHFYFSNNTFTNLMNGALFSNVSDPRSTKNVFTNILYEDPPFTLKGYPNGIGLFVGNDKPEINAWLVCEGRGKNNTQADFDNCRVGLTTVGNVTLYPMNETKMTNVFEGVNSISANASQIKNTNIQASHRGIYFLPGISTNLALAPGFCYENNLINVTGNTNLSTGIELWYSGGRVPLFAVGNFNRTKIANSTILMNGRMGYGMLLNNVKRTILRTGLFTNQPIVNANTINLNAPSVSLGGINLTNSENTDATNNLIASTSNARSIVNTSASPVGLFPVGIYMNMSQDTLRCNSMMNLRTGMRFTGTCANTNMQRNKFYNHTNGLKLDNRSTLKPQLNTGNTWLGSYSGGLAAENSQIPSISRLRIGLGIANKFIPPSSSANFIIRLGSGDNDACTGAIGNGSGSSGSGSGVSNWTGSGLDGIILQGGLAFESYETPLIYQNEAELYEELKPIEDILPDTSDELAFIHQLDTGSIGAFYQIEQKELGYGTLSSADSSLLAAAGYLRDSLERLLSYYDSIRASYEDTLIDNMPDTLRSTIDSSMALLLDQIGPIRTQLDEYHALAFTRLQLQCDTLLQMLSELEAIDTSSRLKKRFLNLYYRTIGRGQRQLDSLQIDSFRLLAQLCPLLEPDAVYRSRAIMRLYEDTIFYDDAIICNASGMEYKSTKQPKTKPQITCTLAPNPTKDITCLEFSSMPLEPLTIMVSDIQGRQVFSETLTLDSKRYELKSSNWINGIYLVKVIHNNLGIFDGKLQVVK